MLSSEVSPQLSALAELVATAIRYDYNGGAIRGKDFRKWFDDDSLQRTSGHEMSQDSADRMRASRVRGSLARAPRS
jgi:hypothetical protein